jgi:hypothetical protein
LTDAKAVLDTNHYGILYSATVDAARDLLARV